jgi:hypothetical protein
LQFCQSDLLGWPCSCLWVAIYFWASACFAAASSVALSLALRDRPELVVLSLGQIVRHTEGRQGTWRPLRAGRQHPPVAAHLLSHRSDEYGRGAGGLLGGHRPKMRFEPALAPSRLRAGNRPTGRNSPMRFSRPGRPGSVGQLNVVSASARAAPPASADGRGRRTEQPHESHVLRS